MILHPYIFSNHTLSKYHWFAEVCSKWGTDWLPGCGKKFTFTKLAGNMSKNTASYKFRNVDVDQYDPDKYNEESVVGQEQGPSESEVNSYLTQYPFKTSHICVCFK